MYAGFRKAALSIFSRTAIRRWDHDMIPPFLYVGRRSNLPTCAIVLILCHPLIASGLKQFPFFRYNYLTQKKYEIICYLRKVRKFAVLNHYTSQQYGTINPSGRECDATCVASE